MAVTYYVALPFIRTKDGTAPGEAQECQSEGTAPFRGYLARRPASSTVRATLERLWAVIGGWHS